MGGDKYVAPGVGSLPPGPLSELFGSDALPVIRVTLTDPAVSARQQRFAGAELARKRAGKKTKTKMTEAQLEEFAKKPKGGY